MRLAQSSQVHVARRQYHLCNPHFRDSNGYGSSDPDWRPHTWYQSVSSLPRGGSPHIAPMWDSGQESSHRFNFAYKNPLVPTTRFVFQAAVLHLLDLPFRTLLRTLLLQSRADIHISSIVQPIHQTSGQGTLNSRRHGYHSQVQCGPQT